jgi:hypothetical protein
MKRYQFTVKEHEEYGTMGFAPKWYPNGDPLGGMAVAHDILSHFPKDDGSAEGEFQATGADLFIRGESGYFQRQGNVNEPKVHLAAEFAMTWGYHTQRDRRTAVKPVGLVRDKDLMEQCRQIVRLGVKNMKDDESGLPLPTAEDQERIARWYAKGYVRARRRYRNLDAYSVAYQLFGPIEEKADMALKHAEEGMILTVLVDYRKLEVKVWCDYPEDEWAQ